MASATEHRPVFNGSLNGNGNGIQNGNGTGSAPKHATRVADDDDSLSTEQFPAFDPSHDGSEEDGADSGDEHYTHAVEFARVDGDGAHDESDDDGAKDKDQGKYVDHVPESEHHSSHHEDDGDDAATTTTTTTTTATSAMTSPSITSPPYWQHGDSHLHGGWGGNGGGAPHPGHGHGHGHAHTHSVESLIPGAITLQDNEAEDEDGEPAERRRNSEETRTSYGRDRNRACWAKSVQVTDYVIVNGSATNIGAFVVWNIRVETLSGPFMNIRKRYSEFDGFRHQLIRTFPNFEAAVPTLPPKSVISKFRPRFLEKRRAGLQYFLNCILLNPEFSGSPVLKDFLFS